MELIEIHRTWNEGKAEQMKSLLDDYDIPCYLASHLTQSVMPFAGQEEIRVTVPEASAEEARKVLESFFDLQSGEESDNQDETV
jgi:hypothetical protein